MDLAERKKKILSAVIESYINTGEPIGSKALIDETGLEVSSATVRNDLADLTNKGYLVQPHTSAGRIPTLQGYRYYIDNLMKITPVTQGGREYVESELYKSADSPESILKEASGVISRLTGCTAVTTTPSGEESRIHRIRFVQTGSHTAMAVAADSHRLPPTPPAGSCPALRRAERHGIAFISSAAILYSISAAASSHMKSPPRMGRAVLFRRCRRAPCPGRARARRGS